MKTLRILLIVTMFLGLSGFAVEQANAGRILRRIAALRRARSYVNQPRTSPDYSARKQVRQPLASRIRSRWEKLDRSATTQSGEAKSQESVRDSDNLKLWVDEVRNRVKKSRADRQSETKKSTVLDPKDAI